jgi:hypothetical protein
MTTALIVIVVVLLVLAVVAFLLMQRRKKEREQLRERFGPEYDRAVDETGDRKRAEHRLSDVAARRDKAEIRELSPAERERFSERWTQAQADFVDDPAGAASSADTLVGEVMRERGYPLDDVEDRGDLVAADHADLAHHYRKAHAIGGRAHEASTEELRQAFVHYRALFTELLGGNDGKHAVAGPGAAAASTHAATHADGTDDRDLAAADRTDSTDRTDMADRTGGAEGRRSELEGQQQLDLTDGDRTRTAPSRETPPA